jgi:hypothetical protein
MQSTTASTIITAGYREGNLIPVGQSPSTNQQNEALDRLNALVNGIFGYELGENLRDWIYPAPQRTAPVAANYPQLPGGPWDGTTDPLPIAILSNTTWTPYPPRNTRIVWGQVAGTIYFPEAPDAGTRMGIVQGSGAGDAGAIGNVLTIDGNGRYIQDPADMTFKPSVQITSASNFTPQEWFYRDDLGQWLLRKDMALTDTLPFPKEFDDFFICGIMVRFAPRYGKVIAQETITAAGLVLKRLKARYIQTAPTVYGSQNFPNSFQSFAAGSWWW